MKNKIFLFLFCSIIFSLMLVPTNAAAADNPCTLVQAYIDGDTLDIIACGDFDLQNADVKVANRQSAISEYGLVSEGKIRVYTTVLVDVSTSMPNAARTKVIEFIETKIKELDGYEELRLVTFGDKVDVIQDFNSDRYDLSNAVKGIEFTGQASAIYDAVYSTIPNLGISDGSPCFYRTIVMTDGVDYTDGGMTKEELFMRLRAETYPIYVVRVSSAKSTDSDKDLAALSRISNGSYAELYSDSDVSECVSQVAVSDLFWIRAEVPVNLLDGSTRQVDVSDGANSFSFDMKMSVVDAPVESSFTSFPIESSVTSTATPTAPIESIPVNETSDDNDPEKPANINMILMIVIAACVLIAGVAVFMVLFLIRRNKKRANEAPPVRPIKISDENDDKTMVLDDIPGYSYTIKLSLCSNPNQSWTITITDDFIVGRADSCDLKFVDKSVSHEQFKLIAGDIGIMLKNLSSANITRVNGTEVRSETSLQAGDVIKAGRISLSVDLVQKISVDAPLPDDNSNGGHDGDTYIVF